MRWKTTLILLLVTVGIGAYISLYEIRQPSAEQRQRLAKRILELQPDVITQLMLDLPKAKVTLTRQGATWTLTPDGVRADPALINQLLRHFDPLMAERIFSGSSPHPLDQKTFGLDPAVGQITFTANASATTLLVGETTPVQNQRYVKISGRPDIFVVAGTFFDAADQPRETFRDHQLVRFDSWTTEALEVRSATTHVSLKRTDNEWTIAAPFSDRAGRTEINAFLTTIAGISIKRFVTDTPQAEELSGWGFDQPKVEVSLSKHGEPATTTVLLFGKPLAENPSLVYAKRRDEPSVYAVLSTDMESLLKDPGILRMKNCFDAFTGLINKIEVTREEGASWVVERSETGQWREAGSSTDLDSQHVDQWLDQLTGLQAEGFLDAGPAELAHYGLQPAAATLTLWVEREPKPQRLLIGTNVPDSPQHYGLIESRQALVRLPELVTSLLDTTPKQLRATSAANASPEKRAVDRSKNGATTPAKARQSQ